MSNPSANRFHPVRWTALTWLALLLWAWHPVPLNFPPSASYKVDPITGELSEPTRYRSLSELPFPIGWPLYYVRPSYLDSPSLPPMPVGAPLPPPAPSTVHPFAMAMNLALIVTALSALIYFLQKIAYQFSLLLLLGVMAAFPLYFAMGRVVAMIAGYNAVWWYTIAVYFSPIPAAFAAPHLAVLQSKVLYFQFLSKGSRCSSGDFDNADDTIAAASRLEMCGDWAAAIDLYRRAAERWPEHTHYVQNCIGRVAEKQSMAQM
jgi:hypothetical protein